MIVPFLDLKKVNDQHLNEINSAISKVLKSGWYIRGDRVKIFENEFSKYCGSKYCVGLGNGLDALSLTLRAWKEMGKLSDGDEVLVPSNTYIASILAITENRLIPVSRARSFNFQPMRVSNSRRRYITNESYSCSSSLWTTSTYAGNHVHCRAL